MKKSNKVLKTRGHKKTKKTVNSKQTSPAKNVEKPARRKYKKREKIETIVEIHPSFEDIKFKKKRKPRSKSSPNKMYFTQDTENAVVEYNSTEVSEKREFIYNTKIKYPFEKLVENVFNTFKFTYFETSPLDVQKETVSHLVSNIQKFDVSKGKAFSYFSIVAKHYLIALNNGTWKRRNQHVDISEEHAENTVQLQSEDSHYKNVEMDDFMKLMIMFWENNVGKIFTKQRDLDIANAVIELFRNSDRIDSFNKKALYLYIREISSCKTQQITKVINKMKQYQTNISKSYLNHGFINTKNYVKN